MKKSYSRAFTLIELLVVIAIIGILTSIVIANLASARSKARDAKRISDIGQIQLALELFYDRCKQYPTTGVGSGAGIIVLATTLANNCPSGSGITLASYISQIPKQPITGNDYSYYVNDKAGPSDYVLSVTLENYNEVLKDGSSLNGKYGATCNQTTGYCVAPR